MSTETQSEEVVIVSSTASVRAAVTGLIVAAEVREDADGRRGAHVHVGTVGYQTFHRFMLVGGSDVYEQLPHFKERDEVRAFAVYEIRLMSIHPEGGTDYEVRVLITRLEDYSD